MGGIKIENSIQIIRLLCCRFSYENSVGDQTQAQKIVEEIETQKLELSESDIIYYLLDKFMFQVKCDNF